MKKLITETDVEENVLSILSSLTRAKLVNKCFGKVYILIFNINFGC